MSQPKAIVVGGGLAGLSAAHTLYERGASVVLLDKSNFLGGNSTKATSGINGAGTQTQTEHGIQDSKKIFFDDTKKSARDLARDDLIKVLTGNSGDAVQWLQDRFALDLSKVSRLGGHSQPRTHRGGAQFPGMTITYAEMEKLEELAENDPQRVRIVKKADVKELLTDSKGSVVGVEYEFDGQRHKEDGVVILASGGYAADFADDGLLAKYRPDTLHLSTTNGPHCTGDGHKMAKKIGARTIDMEKVQVHPTGLVDPNEPDAKVKFLAAEALRGSGGLLLDCNGDRFVDELQHRDHVSNTMFKHDKFPVRLILNGDASREIEWHCKHYTGRGLMKRIVGGDALAKEMGIKADKLKQTFEDMNAICEGKKKDPFGKKFFDRNFTRFDDTFHVALMQPVLHYTMGGLEISPEAEVISEKGGPIPGLFACGEIGGGVHGANRLGGSSLLGCVVYGRVAGAAAASYLLAGLSSGSIAGQRLGQLANQLETKVRIDPATKKVNLEFSWGDEAAASSSSTTQPGPSPAQSAPPAQTSDAAAEGPKKKTESGEKQMKEYTLDEVAKHKTKDDVWVVVNGQVLNVGGFLEDHPGGPKAIMLYAGRDATEEFNMLHDKSVVKKYAADTIIGTLKQ